MNKLSRPPGFTLAELLIALTVSSVVISLGTAGFNTLRAEHAAHASVNELARAFHVARHHAINNGQDVTLCPRGTDARCDHNAGWASGWLMINSDAELLHEVSDHRLLSIEANRREFVLRSFGRRSTNGTFIFCDPRGRAQARRLVISFTGKPRVELAPSDECNPI